MFGNGGMVGRGAGAAASSGRGGWVERGGVLGSSQCLPLRRYTLSRQLRCPG